MGESSDLTLFLTETDFYRGVSKIGISARGSLPNFMINIDGKDGF